MSDGHNGERGAARASGVQWPQDTLDPKGDDLAAPVSDLLVKLALLEKDEDVKAGVTPIGGTPYSLQVITAGATAGTKVAATAASSASVVGALGSAWAAYQASELPLRIALVAAVGVILAAGVIAVALIIRSDVKARADATVAEYGARAAITVEFLRQASAKAAASSSAPRADLLLEALAAFPGHVTAKTAGGAMQHIEAVSQTGDGLRVRLADGDWIDADEVAAFEAEKSPSHR